MQEMEISLIKANKANPRTISKEKYAKLLKSITDFPQMISIRPMVIDENNVVLGGNMRLKALTELGWNKVPVVRVESLTDEQKAEFIAKDNIGYGEWDWDVLVKDWNLEKLGEWGLDIPVQFTAGEAVEDDYEIPETIQTDIVKGDLFEIGRHRLLCGSSTESDDVAKLMGAGIANLMVTDPPYGVNLDQSWRNGVGNQKNNGNKNKIKNDDIADWTSAYSLFQGTVAYIWHATKFTDVIMKNLRDCDFEPNQMLILNKSVMVMGRNNYHWKHEPCWYAIKKGKNHSWIGDRKQVTVIDAIMPASRAQKSEEDRTEHPTQKPIVCMGIPIGNHSGDVYDPFLGSGTTMVASHQLKRICYGMELDPKYCQVIIDRMKKLDPTLTIKKNGVNL